MEGTIFHIGRLCKMIQVLLADFVQGLLIFVITAMKCGGLDNGAFRAVIDTCPDLLNNQYLTEWNMGE